MTQFNRENQIAKLRKDLAKSRPFVQYWNPVATLLNEHFANMRGYIYKISYSTLAKPYSVAITYSYVDHLTMCKLDRIVSELRPILNAVDIDIYSNGYLK